MTELNLIEAGCGPATGRRHIVLFVRKVTRKVIRPWLVRLDDLFRAVIERIDTADRNAASLQGHVNQFASSVVPRLDRLDAVTGSLPSVEAAIAALEEKLSAFQALHWDHVALTRRLASIEDVIVAGNDSARATIEAGEARPLLPFPGLEASHERSSMVS